MPRTSCSSTRSRKYEIWLYHLHRGDYSRWFREAIKDNALADEVARVEKQQTGPAESRTAIKGAIYERYTAPA